jgi:hypothetical protein
MWYISREYAASSAPGVEYPDKIWDDDAVFQGAGWVN